MPDITSYVQHFPYAGLFVLLILGGVGLPFPEDATLVLCGLLISHNTVKAAPAILTVYTGLLIADGLLYLFGRKYGRKIVTHKRFQRILTPERFTAIETQFIKRGPLIIIFGRHFMGLRAQLFITAGVMRMPALKFIALDALTSILTMTIMIGAGYIGGNSLQVVRKDITRIEHAAIVALLVLLIIYLFSRYLKQGQDRKRQ